MAAETPRDLGSSTAYLAYRSAAALANTLPGPVARSGTTVLARALYRTMGSRRRTVLRHMRRVLGPGASPLAVRRAAREVFDSYARYWLEAFRLPSETRETIEAGLGVDGLEHLDAARAAGAGAILAAPHLGGWDFGGAWLAVRGYRPMAVAEVLEPPELFEWFVSWREKLGMTVVPADHDAGRAVLAGLREGRTVGLVSDRDILGSGVEVEFFGETTLMPAGPVTLALRTGAPLLPAAIYYESATRRRGVIRPPLDTERHGRFREDVQRITQVLAGELEDLIRRAPEQWHLLQPNWPSDPGWEHGPVDRAPARKV